jgi:3-oxoacyl-[acyl-carrier protein] reductase
VSRRVAIVTGASRGIGLATARALLEAGDTVALVSRPGDALARAVAGLRAEGLDAHALPGDVGRPDEVARIVAEVSALGSLRLLVNAAGTLVIEPVEATSDESWETTLRTNLTGAFLFCRAAIPHLRAAGVGAIVNVGSVAGLFGAGLSAAYAASKAALTSFSQSLAVELLPDRIRVCAVSPGLVATEMGRGVVDTFGGLFGFPAEPYVTALQGRWATPAEVAAVIAWLGSDEASAISGAHLVADLGQTARMAP